MGKREIANRVCQHLRSAGLPSKAAARLANLTQKWVDCSGRTYCVERWKSLAVYAHQRLINPETPIPPGWGTRVSRRTGKTILADGTLHRFLEVGGKPSLKQLQLLEAIVRIPSAIFAYFPRADKAVKGLLGVVKPFSGRRQTLPQVVVDEFFDWMASYVAKTKGIRHYVSMCDGAREEAIPLRRIPPSKRMSPFVVRDSHGRAKLDRAPRKEIRAISPSFFFQDREAAQLYLENPKFFSMAFYGHPDKWVYADVGDLEPEELDEVPAGIAAGLIKDASDKVRWVLNPCSDIQASLDPLKRVLSRFLRELPVSGVHDQESAKQTIISWLQDGRYCAGFDQSAFTDRFPYAFQRQVLCTASRRFPRAILDLDVKILDLCVQRSWIVPQLDASQELKIKFAVGQPMGLNPSFALATLSHIAAVFSCWRKSDCKYPFEDVCRVVGDDIVISDAGVAQLYEHLMSVDFGVQINRSKSLISRQYTEFCGKVLTPNGEVPAVKYRPILTPQALAQKLNFYGGNSQRVFQDLIEKHPTVLLPFPFGEDVKPIQLSYQEWIKPFSERASTRSINRDISDFVGASGFDEKILIRLAEWDEQNPNLLGPAESRLFSQSERESDNVSPQHRGRAPSFKDVVDNATRHSIRDEIPFADKGQYVTSDGYIDNRQNPPSPVTQFAVSEDPPATDQPSLQMSKLEKSRAVQLLKEHQHARSTGSGKPETDDCGASLQSPR